MFWCLKCRRPKKGEASRLPLLLVCRWPCSTVLASCSALCTAAYPDPENTRPTVDDIVTEQAVPSWAFHHCRGEGLPTLYNTPRLSKAGPCPPHPLMARPSCPVATPLTVHVPPRASQLVWNPEHCFPVISLSPGLGLSSLATV